MMVQKVILGGSSNPSIIMYSILYDKTNISCQYVKQENEECSAEKREY